MRHSVLEYVSDSAGTSACLAALLCSHGRLSLIKHNHRAIMSAAVFEADSEKTLSLLDTVKCPKQSLGVCHLYPNIDAERWAQGRWDPPGQIVRCLQLFQADTEQ